MPYSESDISLEAWLANCRKRCETERLIWFLRQAQLILRTTAFGDLRDRSGTWENPGHLQAALATPGRSSVIRSVRHVPLAAGPGRIGCPSCELRIRRREHMRIKRLVLRQAPVWKPGSRIIYRLFGGKRSVRRLKKHLTRHHVTVGDDDNHHWPQRQWVPRTGTNWHRNSIRKQWLPHRLLRRTTADQICAPLAVGFKLALGRRIPVRWLTRLPPPTSLLSRDRSRLG